MKSEGPLPSSQKPAILFDPETAQSNFNIHSKFLQDLFQCHLISDHMGGRGGGRVF